MEKKPTKSKPHAPVAPAKPTIECVYRVSPADAKNIAEKLKGSKVARIVAALATIKQGTSVEIAQVLKPTWKIKDDPKSAATYFCNALVRGGLVELVAGKLPEGRAKVTFPKAS